MSPSNCPHYDSCSAPICPMDPQWRMRTMLKDEPVCTFIRQASRGEQVAVSLDVVKAQIAAHRYIANTLTKEAARRKRDHVSHPSFKAIEQTPTRTCPKATTPACTPLFSRPHPTFNTTTSEMRS